MFFCKAPTNFVPAVAVKRMGRVLSTMTGRKEHVGGLMQFKVKCFGTTEEKLFKTFKLELNSSL